MTYLIRNKEFRVRHENVQSYHSNQTEAYGRFWFDDTAARLGGTDGVDNGYTSNLTGTQTILQDDIGIIRSTSSGSDSGLPPGEYELIYSAVVELYSTSDPTEYYASQMSGSSKYSTFTPPFKHFNTHMYSRLGGITGIKLDWNDFEDDRPGYVGDFRMYGIHSRFSTIGAANGRKANLRIRNMGDNIKEWHWEEIKITKLS